jgi:EAL domain-containing protein (putative c-di-GMP-specific phosphodiesterase class I)
VFPVTQQEQDLIDDQARQKATEDLVQSWRDRLQLITVIVNILIVSFLKDSSLMTARQLFSRQLNQVYSRVQPRRLVSLSPRS